ncbi:hypothetical protein HBB16_04220 [Pseudonocardia sp. MCCB 268]|nr:hypothetical protein [Pseudonocardia cytotoxica]
MPPPATTAPAVSRTAPAGLGSLTSPAVCGCIVAPLPAHGRWIDDAAVLTAGGDQPDVTALAWSPDGTRIAAQIASRVAGTGPGWRCSTWTADLAGDRPAAVGRASLAWRALARHHDLPRHRHPGLGRLRRRHRLPGRRPRRFGSVVLGRGLAPLCRRSPRTGAGSRCAPVRGARGHAGAGLRVVPVPDRLPAGPAAR